MYKSISKNRGRTAFYEETGVIRDVLQNHLMEVLCLVLRPSVSTSTGAKLSKAAIMGSARPTI